MTIIVALATALLALVAAHDAAALSASPVALDITPAAVVEGDRTTLTLSATRAIDPRAASERVDVYVASVFAPGGAFLTPAGTWSAAPVALRAAVPLGTAMPVVLEWPRATPAGWMLLAVVVVRAGADPFARAGWMFRPAEHWIRIDHAPRTIAARDVVALIALAAATVAGVAVVMRYPRGV